MAEPPKSGPRTRMNACGSKDAPSARSLGKTGLLRCLGLPTHTFTHTLFTARIVASRCFSAVTRHRGRRDLSRRWSYTKGQIAASRPSDDFCHQAFARKLARRSWILLDPVVPENVDGHQLSVLHGDEVSPALLLRIGTVVRVVRVVGLGRSTIHRTVASPAFPSPVRPTNRVVAWRRTVLEKRGDAHEQATHQASMPGDEFQQPPHQQQHAHQAIV
jgi:predicted DNA-binding transcriptional regulator AlpA